MLSFLPIVSSADLPGQNTQHASEEEMIRQRDLLQMFFADISEEGIDGLSKYCSNEPDNYLEWVGVSCKHGIVRSVYYRDIDIGNFNIHALPHSTTGIDIAYCAQNYSVQTRMLPKNLVKLIISHNQIFGTIDLSNLPDSLEEMMALNNNICGPIDLTSLPRDLQTMNLTLNEINQKVVFYGNLPLNLKAASLWRQSGNGIKFVQPISEKHKLSSEMVRKIFGQMKHREPPIER